MHGEAQARAKRESESAKHQAKRAALNKDNLKGFTLVELLVTLAIIAFVSGLVGPALARQFDAIALQTAATEFTAEMRKAQAVARAMQSPVAMTYSGHEFQFWKDSKPIASYNLPPSISPLQRDVPSYVFLPSGQIIGREVLEFENQRGRKIRIKTDVLNGIRYD